MLFADILTPKKIEEIIGQDHLFGHDASLKNILESNSFNSLVFVGPPGCGKTSAAQSIGNFLSLPFYNLHATVAGSNELKNISEISKEKGSTVLLFIDEIHRYSKTQQNLLLKLIDDKLIKLIGASTENPTFSLTPALRSRSFIFYFNKLDNQSLHTLSKKASKLIQDRFNVKEVDMSLVMDDLIRECDGDARRFLNLLEVCAMLGKKNGSKMILTQDGLKNIALTKRYNEDEYYDLLSAMIKSIRGTDPDASLLWCFKLINSGVDPEAIFRRLLISASEDIGNAYPDALIFINNSYEAFLKVGIPEGLIILSHAVTYLASCPKSNRSYLALKKVQEYLEHNNPDIPVNISHSPSGYIYPHDFGGFIKQRYAPDNVSFYKPSDNGFELKISERLKRLWECDEKKD